MIVVFGASGNTGGEAARQLLSQKQKVRVVGRKKAKLKVFADQGADCVEADLLKSADVSNALRGAEVAYFLIPPNFAVADFRQYQKDVTASLGSALASSSCRSAVMLSSMGAEHPTGTGPIVGLYELEQRFKQIAGLNLLAIRAGYFMQNMLSNVAMVHSMGILGTPAPAEAALTLTDATDIGRYAAKRLARRDFTGFEVINLMGPAAVTLAEVAKTIGTAIGKPELSYVQFSYEDAKKGMIAAGLTEDMASLYIEMYQGAARGLLAPQAGTPLTHTQTTFASFAQVFAAAYKAAAA